MRRVADFDPTIWFGPKEVRRVDRFCQFSVAVAEMALYDAGEISVDPARAGVIFATGVGGLETLQEQVHVLYEKGPARVSPFLVPMMMANAGAADDLDAVPVQWSLRVDRHRLRSRDPRDRRSGPPRRLRTLRRCDRRWFRSRDHRQSGLPHSRT